jgi:hypothetical protein
MILLLIGTTLVACDASSLLPSAQPEAQALQSVNAQEAGLGRELAQLRAWTARFQNIDRAMAAGYTVPATPCWYHSNMGAMGYHYANPAFIDGQANLLEPELLVYEPRAGGSQKFVALEYIVPIDAWTGQDPPQLLGRSFARNDGLGLFVLHVWLWRDNPDGIFADWNPKVSCQHAAESEDRG